MMLTLRTSTILYYNPGTDFDGGKLERERGRLLQLVRPLEREREGEIAGTGIETGWAAGACLED